MSKKEYYPADYLDEDMPPGRKSPTAWIVIHDGAPCLAPADNLDGAPPSPLADGAIVAFCYCETHLETALLIRGDSFSLAEPVPPKFELCCILDGWQDETLGDSVEECVAALRASEQFDPRDGDYRIAFYSFSEPAPFRFAAASNTFEPVQ